MKLKSQELDLHFFQKDSLDPRLLLETSRMENCEMPQAQEVNFQARRKINLTRTLPKQNAYTLALDNEYSHRAFNEERAPQFRGLWREKVFQKEQNFPLDVEIGTGNGIFFAHQVKAHPERLLIGLELKYKPLIQSIRRALKTGADNAAICRYHAFNLDELFAESEIDDVYIHFPDPWVTPRKPKNRSVNAELLKVIFNLQKPGSRFYFKTDSREYFFWALEEIQRTPYRLGFQTENLHGSPEASPILTGFEKIFVAQGLPIYALQLHRD